MSQYRKRAVVIEARQLTPENGPDLWEWAESKPFYSPDGKVDGLTIYTLEGRMKADFGDWIVKGVRGEFYPVKPDIFEETYEPVQPLGGDWAGRPVHSEAEAAFGEAPGA
jgi:hypothetical protein